MSEGFVIAACESEVAAELQSPDLREHIGHYLNGPVCGCIVSDYHLSAFNLFNRSKETRKKFLEESFRVPVQYDYGCLHLKVFLVASASAVIAAASALATTLAVAAMASVASA